MSYNDLSHGIVWSCVVQAADQVLPPSETPSSSQTKFAPPPLWLFCIQSEERVCVAGGFQENRTDPRHILENVDDIMHE